jgi:hypothetical protein
VLEHHLIDVTPTPVFAWLKGLNNGVIGRVEMLCSMFVFRGITAAHMSTGETEAQMDPTVTYFQAILAASCAGGDIPYLVEMRTLFCHRSVSFLNNRAGQ